MSYILYYRRDYDTYHVLSITFDDLDSLHKTIDKDIAIVPLYAKQDGAVVEKWQDNIDSWERENGRCLI